MTRQRAEATVILMNDAALGLAAELAVMPEGARVIVAGGSLMGLTLAELALPGAEMIWTDFRQSASLSALHGAVQAAGGLDRLVLAGDGRQGGQMFSLMCAVLTFLPALRRKPQSEIVLVVKAGAAVASLEVFLRRIGGRLAEQGIAVTLQIRSVEVAKA